MDGTVAITSDGEFDDPGVIERYVADSNADAETLPDSDVNVAGIF